MKPLTDIKPGEVGFIFLLPIDPKERKGPFNAFFMRVRMLNGMVNNEDMLKVEAEALRLQKEGIIYNAMVTGRDVPLPMTNKDDKEIGDFAQSKLPRRVQ